MANFGNNNLLGNQKRRNFIYNPAVSRPRDRNSTAAQPVTLADIITSTNESPYKRFKSSHGLSGKRAEEIAAEEACRDLPVDAFDEEIDEDFDDDLLTAEQLDECDRIASKELQTQWTDPPTDFTVNIPQRNDHLSVSGNLVPCSSHLDHGQGSSDEDDVLATRCTQEYATLSTASKARTNLSGAAGLPVSSRIVRVPVVTIPPESTNLVKAAKKDDSLLESSVCHSKGSSSFVSNTRNSNMDCGDVEKAVNLVSNSRNNYCSVVGDHSDDGQLQLLRKEIEKLKSEFMTASAKVKTLEEEKFCKDGEIRILRDSLSYFEAEEKKRQGEVKAIVEKQAREQSQHEKELEKQVENLTTQIQFKDREISQMIERNKKRASSSTEVSSTPQKKTVNLSEVFPTGSSFFQKTSPETKVKSPRCTKTSLKDLKTPRKHNSQRVSEGDHSENSMQSGSSSGTSSLERMKTQRRDAETSERDLVQLCTQCFPDVELVQNLLSPQDKECHVPFQNLENRVFNDGSIISLDTLNTSSASSYNATQRTTLNETDTSHTLRLFDTQMTSKLQRSIAVATQKGNSLSDRRDNSLVLQTLSGLLNHCYTEYSSLGESKNMNMHSRFKHNKLSSATNFLPSLESHIALYVEHRTESNDDNILSTCLLRISPTPDSPEQRDSPGFESEHSKNLALLQENALISLRLLNILVLYSCEVCECILKSARVFTETDTSRDEDNKVLKTEDERRKIFSCKEEEGSFSQHPLFSSLKIAIKKDLDKQMLDKTTEKDRSAAGEDVVRQTELLGYLFKLLVPQPKESMTVAYATLQVLTSLARNCEVKYCTRMLPLLSDSLLSQFLSRDWCVTSLSLVTALLTPLTRHADIVKRLCSQSDDCILLKIYQGWVLRSEDVPVIDYEEVHLQIVGFVNNLLSNSDAFMLFPMESECQCSIELIKCLVLMLDKVMNSLAQLPSDSLTKDTQNSHSVMLLRQGVFLLSTLCLNDRLFAEHRVDVENQYINVVSSVSRLYQRITGLISEAEVLAVQDLVDFEHIDGIEWSPESEDEIDETIEGMDVDE